MLHAPLTEHSQLMTVWNVMESIYQQGGASQLGISNCYSVAVLQRLYDEATVKPAVLQNRFYPETAYDSLLRQWCHQQQIIYQSFWTLTANPHILTSPALVKIATAYQKTPAQIFFRYLTQIGIVPLTGTSSEQHMREDLAIFQFELSGDDRRAIASLLE